jgi:hypothetical protein
MESQYTVDLKHKTATASRGGAPNSVQITPTSITINQGNMVTMISRITGSFSQQLSGALPLTGTCEPARAAKF